MNLLQEMHQQYIIPVLRETNSDLLEGTCLALAAGGLKILEVTLMSETAYDVIKKLSTNEDLIIGAGTVLNTDQAQKVINCGAKFLVSPGLNIDVLRFCKTQNIPSFPGVMTPTEIMQAQAEDCQLVKIFPISVVGGASYLQALKGPFPQLKIMPTGGVSLQNLKLFLQNDAFCVGMGGQLVSPELIKNRSWSAITNTAKDYLHQLQLERKS